MVARQLIFQLALQPLQRLCVLTSRAVAVSAASVYFMALGALFAFVNRESVRAASAIHYSLDGV
jgi:hypothetical protein